MMMAGFEEALNDRYRILLLGDLRYDAGARDPLIYGGGMFRWGSR